MKKLLLILSIFIAISTRSNSQDWFPVGASWYYNQIVLLQGETYVYFEVVGEDTINGKACRIISGACNCGEPEIGGYVYEEDDKVYVYNSNTEQFVLLYDFTLVPGDTMHYHFELTGDTYYRLDSITYLQLPSDTLRVQHFTWLEGWSQLGYTIYERMGSGGCLYPQVGFCDPGTGGLRCYEDDSLGLVKFSPPNIPCTYSYTVSTSHAAEADIRIYPIPAQDKITLEGNYLIETVEWIDIHSGIVIHKAVVDANAVSLETFDIHPGLYLLKVNLAGGSKFLKKVLISH